MAKIRYPLGHGQYEEIEVSEEAAKFFKNEQDNEQRRIWREQKRKDSSFDYLESLGIEFSDKRVNTEEDYISKETNTLLYLAIEKLEPQQKELVRRHFFNDENLRDIAKEQGVTYQAIQNRMKKILEKLKKHLAEGVV